MKQVYPSIQRFFTGFTITAIASVLSNIDALAMLGNLGVLVGWLISLFAISSLRPENRRFVAAFKLNIAYIILAIVFAGVLTGALAVLLLEDSGALLALGAAALLLAVAVLVVALAANYQTYQGFEEIRELRQIDYPPRRILWCFYIGVFSMIMNMATVAGSAAVLLPKMEQASELAEAGGVLLMVSKGILVAGVLLAAVQIWLLYTYWQAAKAALDAEMHQGWS